MLGAIAQCDGTGLVDALERAGAEGSAVDDRVVEDQPLQRRAVQHAAPLPLAAEIEAVGMLEAEQGLGVAVAGLLPQVGAGRLAAVVPDHRRRRERDPVTGCLQTPTDVNIVAGAAELRIEAVDRQQGLAAEGHVAAGYVLGHLVALQDVHRLPRRGGHAGRHARPRAGARFGPPTAAAGAPACGSRSNCAARCVSQSGWAMQSESV